MAWTWFWGAKLQKFCNISWARRLTGFKFIIRRLAAGGSGRVNPVDSSSGPNVEVSLRAAIDPPASGYGAYAEAMSNYCPKPVAVPVVYFAIDFNGHPWRQICSDLEIIRLAGTHYDYDFAELARHLRVRL
jgi:hypothetical protein